LCTPASLETYQREHRELAPTLEKVRTSPGLFY
jgi:hypothetical protein